VVAPPTAADHPQPPQQSLPGAVPAVGNADGLLTSSARVFFVEPGDRTPIFHNWQFNLQRELPAQILVELAYVGSRGVRLVAPSENLNQVRPTDFGLGPALKQQVPNPFFGILTSGSLTGATVAREQLLRPYPQFTGVSRSNPAYGNSVYHSFQLRIEKRLAHGITTLVSYTISKNLSDLNGTRDAFNRSVERAVSDIDVPERLTVAGAGTFRSPQLPLVANASRAVDLIAGGWQLSTFCTYQAGFAQGFGFTGGTFAAGTGPRANVSGDPSEGISGAHNQRLDRYFNTSVFSAPANFTLGNLAPRVHTVRIPGMDNVNLTVSKDFTVVEEVVVQFRASAYNALNHPVFGGANTTVGNASFGRISSQANLSRQIEFGLRLVF
jgi:hypothetical protein